MNYKEYIKINLPGSAEAEESGNGEGVFMLVDERTKEAHDNDETGGQYIGVLDNDSLYFSSIKHGALIPFEMRGNNRPVASYIYLIALNYIKKFTEEDINNFEHLPNQEILKAFNDEGILSPQTVNIFYTLATGNILN